MERTQTTGGDQSQTLRPKKNASAPPWLITGGILMIAGIVLAFKRWYNEGRLPQSAPISPTTAPPVQATSAAVTSAAQRVITPPIAPPPVPRRLVP
jgi:hypothetical protein